MEECPNCGQTIMIAPTFVCSVSSSPPIMAPAGEAKNANTSIKISSTEIFFIRLLLLSFCALFSLHIPISSGYDQISAFIQDNK